MAKTRIPERMLVRNGDTIWPTAVPSGSAGGRSKEAISEVISKIVRTNGHNHGRCCSPFQIEPNFCVSRSNDLETRGNDTLEELSHQDKSE